MNTDHPRKRQQVQNARARPLPGGAVVLFAAAAALAVCFLIGPAKAGHGEQQPWVTPVPKANCQPGDRTETGLQGQLTLAERANGDSLLPYNCNLETVGQVEGVGASHQLAWYKDCAYHNTAGLGVQTIDASDPRHPYTTAVLDAPALLNPHESLHMNERRKLVGGVGLNNNTFALYDVSDCRNPVLLSSVVLPDDTITGHAGNFAPDGRTYYGVDLSHCSVYAIDIKDPENPTMILNWHLPAGYCAHYVSVSHQGTRLYIGQPGCGLFPANVCLGLNRPDGLVIADISDIQFRRPNPQIKIISSLFWNDSGIGEVSLAIRIRGKRFMFFTSEIGSAASPAVACAANAPPWGFARLIDISDELHPKETAKLMLEINDPANCSMTQNDTPPGDLFGYSVHDCGVDNPHDARLLACSHESAGVRVFDIHDPYHPREIAYYKGAARGNGPVLPGSSLAGFVNPAFTQAKARSRFVHHGKELYLWITSVDNGFLIERFTNTKEIREILRDNN